MKDPLFFSQKEKKLLERIEKAASELDNYYRSVASRNYKKDLIKRKEAFARAMGSNHVVTWSHGTLFRLERGASQLQWLRETNQINDLDKIKD